jgi:sugar lactone lactonase YvrE
MTGDGWPQWETLPTDLLFPEVKEELVVEDVAEEVLPDPVIVLPRVPTKMEMLVDLGVPTEGLAFDGKGNLFLSTTDGRILKVTSALQVQEFVRLLPTDKPSMAGNAGLTLGPDNALYVARYQADRIERVPLNDPSAVTVFLEGMDGPNSLLFDSEGTFWFTASGMDTDDGFVGRLDAEGNIVRVVEPVVYANGLALTADRKTLYYTSTDPGSVHKVALTEALVAGVPELVSDSANLSIADGLLLVPANQAGEQGLLFAAGFGMGYVVGFVLNIGADMVVASMPDDAIPVGTASLAWGRGAGFSRTTIYATNLLQNGLYAVDLGEP